jgi:L-asparaginase
MKKILIIFTGGTISMTKDPSTNSAVPTLSGEEILKTTPTISEIADTHTYNFAMIPGPHMSPDKMFELSKLIKEKIQKEKFDGVVVTHGTDTLEETAYFVDLTYNLKTPVVFVGALKSSSDIGWDGSLNLIEAVYTAASDSSYYKGVLVVLNSEIHAASQVTKAHTHKLNAFQSPETGPLGFVDNNNVFYYHRYIERKYINISSIDPKVDIIKCVSGMDDKFVRCAVESGSKGIILEGTGRGNIPPALMDSIKYAISKNVVIVLVSRCHMGKVFESYGYEGSGMELLNLGVIRGNNLPGQKARIKLIVALAHTNNTDEIRKIFEENHY